MLCRFALSRWKLICALIPFCRLCIHIYTHEFAWIMFHARCQIARHIVKYTTPRAVGNIMFSLALFVSTLSSPPHPSPPHTRIANPFFFLLSYLNSRQFIDKRLVQLFSRPCRIVASGLSYFLTFFSMSMFTGVNFYDSITYSFFYFSPVNVLL